MVYFRYLQCQRTNFNMLTLKDFIFDGNDEIEL